MRVFVSSTFKDLEPHRAAVIARLRKLDGVEVRCMEDFGARDAPPRDYCVREARACDLFIGIVGHLYGFVPVGDSISITEQELLAAEDAERPRLMFVAHEDFPVSSKLLRGDSAPERQDAFRARILAEYTTTMDWDTPEELAVAVQGAVYNVVRDRSGPRSGGARGPARIDGAVYAQRCRKRWEVIDLSALATPGAVDGDVDRPRLSQVFIPQACRRSRPAVSLPRDYLKGQGLDPDAEERLVEERRARWEREERLPALELIARPEARTLVLLGDPGAGKSALTRYVVLKLLDPPDTAAGDGARWRTALGDTWPVLVELRDFLVHDAAGRCRTLLDYLAHLGETEGFGFDRGALEAQLRDRPSLLVIDGLDEVFAVDRRRALVEEIIGIEGRFPKLRVLVTSRIAGFDARPFEAAGFAVATLDDLDAAQVRTFAERWFDLAFPGEPDKAARARDDLLATVERRPQIAAIAGNPLILTIMAIIARHERLARSRAQIYAQALRVLCYAWDYRRGLKLLADSPLVDLQPDDTLLLLRRIAWHMQEGGAGLRANAIGEAELLALLTSVFAEEWGFPRPRARRAGAEMVERLQERSWVLTLRGPGLYGFVHRTFLEYLCAYELRARFESQELSVDALRDRYVLPRAHEDSYAEVIRLLCGQLPPRAAGQLVQALCTYTEDVNADEVCLLLAWQALSELEPRTLVQVPEACECALSGLYTWVLGGSAANFLRGVDAFAGVLDLVEPGSWPATAVEFDDLPHRGPGRADFVVRPIIRALARAMWLPAERGRSRLTALLGSADSGRRWRAVIALHEDTSPGTYQPLWERAVGDEDATVRQAAVEALAGRSAERAETYGLLRGRATGDLDADVRLTAVKALEGRFAERPETYALLRGRAEADPHADVRAAAALGWGRRFAHPSRILMSRDFDGVDPGVDPLEPISPERVNLAAAKLNMAPDEVRAAYERLVDVDGVPLRLTWRTAESDTPP